MARKTDVPSVYYGEPRKYDPKFRGPIQDRSRTDVMCSLIFAVVITVYVILGFTAWFNGDPGRFIHPTDSNGELCGQKENKDKTRLFYFDILQCVTPAALKNRQCATTQICVSECPDKFLTRKDAQKSGEWQKYKAFCKTELNGEQTEECPSMIYPSSPFLRRCFPRLETRKGRTSIGPNTTLGVGQDAVAVKDLKDAASKLTAFLHAKDVSGKVFEDLANSWEWILIGMAISMVVSLIFLLLLRYIAGPLLWIMIWALIFAILCGIGLCYLQYYKLSGKVGSDRIISDIGFQMDFGVYLELTQTWLIFMLLLAVIEGIILLILLFLRKRLEIAIALLVEASMAMRHVMTALIYPIFTFFLLSLVIAYGAVVAVCLATSGVATYTLVHPEGSSCDKTECDPTTFKPSELSDECKKSRCLFNSYRDDNHSYSLFLQAFNLFAFLWLVNFILALGQCTLAGAFASYYWALKKPSDIPACPLFTSFNRAISFHVGSLAFGALVLSGVQMIRICLTYLDQKLKGQQNSCARFMMACLKYCFWCLERFIKFLNKNAYIMIAIYGKSFFTSSRDAFFLLMRNVIRVAVLDKITDFLLFLGKLLIAGIVGAIAFFSFTQEGDGPPINYYWVPLVLVILGSYVVAHGFFSVYTMCVDTLFLCFCEDLERNDGSADRPYYMSPNLCYILDKNNERPSVSSSNSRSSSGSSRSNRKSSRRTTCCC
ncbi:choline transporter-like protein 5-B isoform X2 [Festucalex cinctus]